MKKGFTLIELLAVIMILAIVALIATPIILNVVDDARISAGESESQMIYSGINNYCVTSAMKNQLNGTADICADGVTPDEVSQMVNLGNAQVESITYSNGKVTNLVVNSNTHKFTLCGDGSFAMDDEACNNDTTGGDVALVGSPIEEKAKELVYKNETCKTDGTTYQYMGGCYLKGNPNNNYIWYSGFLWRIMGINADGTVRLITDEAVTAIPWGESNTAENWDESHSKDWLNNYFYPRLKENDIIVEQTWCSETTTSVSSSRIECTTNLSTEPTNVGTITLDEYNLAGMEDSYLNMGQTYWTITSYNSSNAFAVVSSGTVDDVDVSNSFGLRAVINVSSDVIITGGNGTVGETWSSEEGPYILNEDKKIEVTGKLNEKATSGEYVVFAGKKYRVVDKDSNGNVKLILDSYYEETSGTVYTMGYGSNNIFSITTGIGQKLNGDVLEWLVQKNDTENRNKLVENYKWYQNNFEFGNNYTVSLEEIKSIRSVEASVGLIRIGEMLSGSSSSILTKGYTTTSSYSNVTEYWTMTVPPDNTSAWTVNYAGNGRRGVSRKFGLRPVIVVNSSVTITGGNGTWSNPYKL